MLLAMAMAPLSIMAGDFTPDLFPGQPSDRTQLEISATVAVGDFGQAPNTHSWVTNLTSTNESVVRTYNQNGYTAVLIVGVGTADVTYTETMFTSDDGGGGSDGSTTGIGASTNHTIHYTVVKGTPKACYTIERQPITETRALWYGEGQFVFNPPSLEMIVKEVYLEQGVFPKFQEHFISQEQCQMESSNTAVATVSRRGVTPVGLGETTIRATWAGDDKWNSASAEYKLKVEIPKTNVVIGFTYPEITGTVGEEMAAPAPIITPSGVTIDRWGSSDPEVASVDEKTGKVTMLKKGTTYISAYVDEDETYYAAQGWYRLTVNKPKAGIKFNATDIYAEIGAPWTRPTLLNPNNVDLSKCIWYTEPDNPVADITEDGKEITIKTTGNTTIYCQYNAKDEEFYDTDIASFVLHVSTIGLKVMGQNVTHQNLNDILGDGLKKATYDRASHTLTLNDWNLDAGGLDEAIADGVILNESEEQLNINLVGNSSILNAKRCIVSLNGPVVIMSNDKNNTLTLTASLIAIHTSSMKIYDSRLHASGGETAIKLTDELSVYKGGYIYAETTSDAQSAIMAQTFVKGKDDSGGIEILTKNVVFNDGKSGLPGFYTDKDFKIPAKIVEIGKVPITPSSESETTIEFSGQDPEGNDFVLFSSSANDTYNKETGQLEISTSLTDEQVGNALESVIPGSSAWINLLPGSLVFDVPAGSGVISVNCLTIAGYSLKVKVQGETAITITQSSPGWAEVAYNVAVPTHVVVYLHASSSPARGTAQTRKAAATAGAFISAVKIKPGATPSSIDELKAIKPANGKYLVNGQLYIVRNGKTYTVAGVEMTK